MVYDVTVVTGASSGIGAACAFALSKVSRTVVLIGRNQERLDSVGADVRASGAKPYSLALDITNSRAVYKTSSEIQSRFGRIGAFVHAAGEIRPISKMADADHHLWLAGFRANAEGTYNCVRSFFNELRMEHDSTFLGVTSYADRYYTPGESQYSAGKAASFQILKYAEQELLFGSSRIIRFNPGAVATPMQDAILKAGLAGLEDGPIASVLDISTRVKELLLDHSQPSGDYTL